MAMLGIIANTLTLTNPNLNSNPNPNPSYPKGGGGDRLPSDDQVHGSSTNKHLMPDLNLRQTSQ